VNAETRHCPKCDTDKPVSDFYTSGVCKPCQILYELHRRKINREKFRAYRRGYMKRTRNTRKNRGQGMLPLESKLFLSESNSKPFASTPQPRAALASDLPGTGTLTPTALSARSLPVCAFKK
jgi:hypothetical protein